MLGHDVHEACSGEDGLARFKTGRFDLVVLDRSMQGMSGDEAALAMKAVAPGTPIILLTGFGEIMKEEGVMPEGIDFILSKPITRGDLEQAMKLVLHGRR